MGSIKRAGSPVGNLTGGSVTYSNNLEKIETHPGAHRANSSSEHS
jgi:hypothetical protein